MAFLDEIAALLEGSSAPIFPIATGGYWTGVSSSETGLQFNPATSDSLVLGGFTTSSSGINGNVVGDYIEDFDNTIGPGSKWPLYRGVLPDSSVISDRAVGLIETPGEGQTGRVEIDKRGLTVLVRGVAQSSASTAYEEAESKAVTVRDVLHEYSGSSDTAGTHYVGIWAETGPDNLGYDAQWRPNFTSRFRAWRSRT